ncbi:MAG: 8-oxo-dGTP diphosphatase [Oscillospiraceae bacterium]|nr:8-oxo-dGTP diphosphatase [Oscillospiraceae bacterium]
MRITESAEFTNMCMIRDGDRILVQDRVDPKWPGATFPGGHVEAGESFTDAVIREVYEETGLTVLHPRLCGIKDWCDGGRRYVVLLYAAERFSGILRSSDEGKVSWVPLAELPKLRLADDMDKLLEVFLREELSEFFYRQKDGKWTAELK